MHLKDYLKNITTKYLLKKIKQNWKEKYRFVVLKEETFQEKISFRLSPMNTFVFGIFFAAVLVFITALLIAFTPLKVYVPGYTTATEYHKLRSLALRTDSLARKDHQNELYLNNLKKILTNGDFEDEMKINSEIKNQKEKFETPDFEVFISEQEDRLRKEADQLKQLTVQNTSSEKNGSLNLKTVLFIAPVNGVIVQSYRKDCMDFGVGVHCVEGAPVKSVLNGIVLYSGWDPAWGNIIIVQHANGIVTQYKKLGKVMAKSGTFVCQGDVIALMNSSQNNQKSKNILHFELWFNGIAVSPEEYISFKG